MAKRSTKAAFVAFLLICLQTTLWTIKAEASVIVRREIAKNVSPETQATRSAEHLTTDSSTIEHVSTTARSTKLMPQIAALNETTELPKKTTLKLVNDPISTSSDEASEKVKTQKTERKDFAMTEPNDRVSDDKQRVENLVATTKAETSTTQLSSSTTPMPNIIDTESATTKQLNIKQKSDEFFGSKAGDSTVANATIDDNTSRSLSVKNITNLADKRMDLLLDDSVDIQTIKSSSSSKQPKFLNDNSTNSNQLNLPSTADVWTLAGMKNTPMPRTNSSDNKIPNSSNSSSADAIKEKVLTDWTQIVKNALTDDEDEKATPKEASETTELLENSTIAPANISALYTTTPTTSQTSHASHTELNHKTDEKTTIPVNIEKEFHNRLLNNTLVTLTSTIIASSTESSLSENDNIDMETATRTIAPTVRSNEELTKEKSAHDAQNNKEKKEALELSANQTSVNSSSAEILNTRIKFSPVEMMSSSSTPATGFVSDTTARNLEVRRENILTSGITEGEKAVTAAITEIETTTSSNTNVAEASNIETTTSKSTPTSTSNIDEKPSKVILATNVKEAINLAAITTQPTPDIHQNSTKSNLETPTTTTAPAIVAATTTIEIETTPTSVKQNNSNSSAIASEIETTTTTSTSLKRAESQDEASVTTASVFVTVDSLNSSSSRAEFSLAETTTTTKPAVTTTTTIRNAEEAEQVTKATTDLDETTINKDFIETTTFKPLVSITENHNSNETSTKSLIDESETSLKTSTISSLAAEKVATSESVVTTISSTTTTATTARPAVIETPNSAVEMNANNASINSSNSTKPNELATATTTVSPATKTSTTATATSTSTILSVSTNTDDLYETFPETTTLAVATENSTEAETLAVTSSTTPSPMPIETTAVLESDTTTLKTIEEMIPTTTIQPTTITLLPTQYEAAPSMPATTTISPLILPGDVGGILQVPAQPKSTPDHPETDVNVVIAISVSVIGVVALILLVAFLYLMRKRQKQTTYGQRCRPVSLDAYSLDNVSVMGSMRKRPSHRSKRSYGNAAFQDPALKHNVIQTAAELAEYAKRRTSIFQEFDDVPKVTARADEIPQGCEDKNRYANVIPLPETRVILQRRNDDDTTEYINANYVRGPSDAPNYYIACQAPLESTVQDFWRMIWEQQSRVIVQATDLIEEGKERCAEYLPPSVTLDNHTTYGDFQVTLKNREVKDKYAISTILLKNTALDNNANREITHYWYKWPETGVPTEEAPLIAMLLEARSSLKSYAIEAANELKEKSNTSSSNGSSDDGESKSQINAAAAGTSNREINGNISEKAKNIARHQGPLTIHCSPGTGRTGTIIACDMAIRSLETTKSLDIPQIVYDIRRGRASAVQTKDQYEFIYKVANVYAMKITNVSNDN